MKKIINHQIKFLNTLQENSFQVTSPYLVGREVKSV